MMSNTVYSFVICIMSVTLFVRLRSFSSPLLPHAHEGSDQRTQAHAVDVIDSTKIEQNLLMSLT